MVGSMNSSERTAYNWLREEKGYNKSDITRKNAKQTPDFKCPDKEYEVKRLYSSKIVFYDTQIKDINEETKIIVVEDGEVIECFKWGEKEQSEYDIKISDGGNGKTKWLGDRAIELIEEEKRPGEDPTDTVRRALYNLKESSEQGVNPDELAETIADKVERRIEKYAR